ncbi:hypothetical protein [Nocardioides marmoraquaticus]
MTDRRAFDLPGRLFNIACLLLLSALAINLAVALIQDVWVWLAVGAASVGAGWLLVRLAIWWQRRRLW